MFTKLTYLTVHYSEEVQLSQKPHLLKHWDYLSDLKPSRQFINRSADILELFENLSDIKKARLKEIYNNLRLPDADFLPRPFPSTMTFTFLNKQITIKYNKFGFPELSKHMTFLPGPDGKNLIKRYPVELGWTGKVQTDLLEATKWALENYPPGKVRIHEKINDAGKIVKNKQKIDILIEGGNPNNPADWIEQTWHHHENGIDLMPIPTKIHNTALHSGGDATKYGKKAEDPDLSYLFTYEVEYK